MGWMSRFIAAVAFLAIGVIFSPETFGSSSSKLPTYSAAYYYTMATALSRFSLFVTLLLLFLLVASLFEPTHSGIVGDGASIRSLRSNQRNNRIVDCSEVASKSHCSQYSNKCRWCRSEALDDMCFSKSEAWRLPSQVFVCD